MRSNRERSVLDFVDAAVSGPNPSIGPLVIDVTSIPSFTPTAELPLTSLRPLLLQPRTSDMVREAVWAELAFLARSRGDAWQVGALWMMAPGLRGLTWRIVNARPAPYPDIESAAVEGFLCELRSADLDSGRIYRRLWWAAYRGGLAAREAHTGGTAPADMLDPSCRRRRSRSHGHPDQVLERAVRAGVLSRKEAELIGLTRLENGELAQAAHRLGMGYLACRAFRAAAEDRLACFLGVAGHQRDAEQQATAERSCRGLGAAPTGTARANRHRTVHSRAVLCGSGDRPDHRRYEANG
ncbi:hypothetical protein [Kitasatospora sp. NBC_01266]|uniref:hypothetical protein n=1 Tax=Kitasatospora sp. NBC_01266 TaxID=2903572 RepID=UPI002E33D241|nr:hypothetical protein [Kitasatospora sp. NBC_01266]